MSKRVRQIPQRICYVKNLNRWIPGSSNQSATSSRQGKTRYWNRAVIRSRQAHHRHAGLDPEEGEAGNRPRDWPGPSICLFLRAKVDPGSGPGRRWLWMPGQARHDDDVSSGCPIWTSHAIQIFLYCASSIN